MSNWVAGEFSKLKSWIESKLAPLHSRVSALESELSSIKSRLAAAEAALVKSAPDVKS